MNRFTLKPNSIFLYSAEDEVGEINFQDFMRSGHTDPITSKKKLYQSDAYYYTGGGIDTESSTAWHFTEKVSRSGVVEKKPIVDYCFCYCYQFAIGQRIYIFRTLKQVRAFLLQLIKWLQNQPPISVKSYDEELHRVVLKDFHPKFILWCANFSHEFAFLKGLFADLPVTHFFANSDRQPLFIEFGEVLQIRECLGLFGHSLADIANHHTSIRKMTGDLDYTLIRTAKTKLTDTELRYIIYDVYILAELHKKVISTLAIQKGNNKIVIPFTSTGYIRNEVKEAIELDENVSWLRSIYANNTRQDNKTKPKSERRRIVQSNLEYLCNENEALTLSQIQWNICRNYSYAGGLCGSNPDKVAQRLTGIRCFDITSDYPAQMNQELYPVGALKSCSAPSKEALERYKEKGIPFFCFMRVDLSALTNHCVFSYHKIFKPENGYCTTINGKVKTGVNINVCWNDVDIKAYELAYKVTIKEIYAIWYFPEGYGKLPDYILKPLNHRYLQKCKLKIDGKEDTQDYSDSKRFVNGFYGMCATKERYFEILFEKGYLKENENKTFLDIKKEMWLNPYIAFWCTSYARKILIYFISKYPDAVIQYDTDSLYIDSSCSEILREIETYNQRIIEKNKALFDDSMFYDLGTFSSNPDKDIYDLFIACGAKKYVKVKGDKITPVIAGLPKNTLDNMQNDYSLNEIVEILLNLQQADFNILHDYHKKLASKYYDCNDICYIKITDYTGEEYIQDITSYHALLPIDFNLRLAPTLKAMFDNECST